MNEVAPFDKGPNAPAVELNLAGQRLGRKGQTTRARIIDAARELIAEGAEEPLSLSAVARRADLRMSAIYNYFADMSGLFLCLLEPLNDESETAYIGLLREYWPDAELDERCFAFVSAFHEFWRDNARLLHMRNAIADQFDERVMLHRINMARGVIHLLGRQMGETGARITGVEFDLASVLYTGLERVVTIATDERFHAHYPPTIQPRFKGATLTQHARLIRLAIADERARNQEISL